MNAVSEIPMRAMPHRAAKRVATEAAKCCLVVADRLRARIFVCVSGSPGVFEARAELTNAFGASRCRVLPSGVYASDARSRCTSASERASRSEIALDRDFAHEIAREVEEAVAGWKSGSIIVAAAPLMLGMLRDTVQSIAPGCLTVKAVAKDYTTLDVGELRDWMRRAATT